MCNLYSHTKGPKAIRDLAKAMGGEWKESAGNLEPQPSIYPDYLAPIASTAPEGGWDMKRQRLSPRYTTCADEMLAVRP